MSTTLPDTLLDLVHKDGYSVGESTVITKSRPLAYVDANKDGQWWRVMAPTRYEAVVELMLQLGWDLGDGRSSDNT